MDHGRGAHLPGDDLVLLCRRQREVSACARVRGSVAGGIDVHRKDKNMKSRTRSVLRQSALAAAIAGICAPASAAFFQIAENNASGIGNAFAGGAAIAEDASTVWYNPAGMTRLKDRQLVVSGHYIYPSFNATVVSASTTTGSPIGGGGGGAGAP